MNATQLALPDAPRFDGSTYLPFRDDERLTGQLRRIWSVVSDQRMHTLAEIAQRTGDPEASISAQLRHLRKPRFGGHAVNRNHLGNGLYEYRLVINPDAAAVMAAAPLRRRGRAHAARNSNAPAPANRGAS